jgi:hypothetical protein
VVKLVIFHPNVLSKKTTQMKREEKERINLRSLKIKSLLKGPIFTQGRITKTLQTLKKKNMSQIQLQFLMDLEKQISNQEKKDTKECEVVVDMEGELISSLEEISQLKKNNRLRKEKLHIYK